MTALVYGKVERSLVFIDRAHAIELAAIWRAIGSASTWGELRALMPEKRYAALVVARTEDGEEIPSDDAPFTGYDIPGVADGDYPEWPAQEMLMWVPQDILDRSFCQVKDSVFNGRFLILDPSRETEIVDAFQAVGFECVKDQALVSFAAGHGA